MTCGQQFLLGGSQPIITLNASYSPESHVPNPTDATAQFELTSGGDIRMTTANNTVNDVGDWLSPKSGMNAFDAMLSVNSGSTPTGSATATWLNLGTTRNWQLAQTVLGVNTSNCTLQIRRSSTGAVLDSSTIVFTAEVT